MPRSLYDTVLWRKVRKRILKRDPLCKMCFPKLEPAKVVDHIKPYRKGDDFWDETNMQGLCTLCHNKKSVIDRSELMRKRLIEKKTKVTFL